MSLATASDIYTFKYNGKEYPRERSFINDILSPVFNHIYRKIIPGHLQTLVTTNNIEFAMYLESKHLAQQEHGDKIFVRLHIQGELGYATRSDDDYVCPDGAEYWRAILKCMSAVDSVQYLGQHLVISYLDSCYVLFLEKLDYVSSGDGVIEG